jgi:hypothetical protein
MASRHKRKPKSDRLIYGMGANEEQLHADLAKSMLEVRGMGGPETEAPSLAKSLLNVLNGPGQHVERLAFEVDPTQINTVQGTYVPKLRLVPSAILKRIAIQDSLVSTIVRGRQEQLAPFGRPRPTRFANGFMIEAKPGVTSTMDKQGKAELKDRIDRATKLLASCGHTDGLEEIHQHTLSDWLATSVRSAIVVGYISTEVTYVDDESGKPQFHHFVAADAATIFRAVKDEGGQNALDAIRRDAFNLLSSLAGNKDLIPEEKPPEEPYSWVQVIDGNVKQAFTSSEMKVYNFYPVPDIELQGYPVTPIDTVISAITTHINITTHNKLYFQSGRATRGMLLIKSDDATPQSVHNIKQHFNNSINNVNNSWRMPVFSCGIDENITWSPIDSGGGRDMEFQYLTDMNAREIMSAFMMSPDELPGWSYLSRGTNNQSLSESNNEYKLEAARDLGIRPLISKFEDFINIHLLPLIDPELAKQAAVRLVGIDADNAEKEAVRTEQDMNIWMTFDDINERVEKEPVGKEWCGTIPLNPAYQTLLYAHKTVGEIEEHYLDRKDASKDPNLAYRRDPFWFQQQQLLQQAQQLQMQQQQAAQGQPPPGGGGGPPPAGGGGGAGGDDQSQGGDQPAAQTEKQKTDQSGSVQGQGASGGSPGAAGSDLGKAIDQAVLLLKSDPDRLSPELRRMLAQHNKTLEFQMKGFEDDLKEVVREAEAMSEKFKPRN